MGTTDKLIEAITQMKRDIKIKIAGNKYEEALAICDKLDMVKPHFSAPDKMSIYFKLGIYFEVIRQYQFALNINMPVDINIYNKSLAKLNRDYVIDVSDHIMDFEIIKSNKITHQYFYNRAKSYNALGVFEQAILEVEEAIRIMSSDPKYLLMKAIILTNLERFEEARNTCNQRISIKDDRLVGELLSMVYSKMVDTSVAIPQLEEYLKKNPDAFYSWYDLGLYNLKNNNVDNAENAFKQAIAIAPNFLKSYFKLIEIYQKRGDFLSVLEVIKTISKYTNNQLLTFHIRKKTESILGIE